MSPDSNEELLKKIENLQRDVDSLRSGQSTHLSKFSAPYDIDDYREIDSDYFREALWNSVFYHSSFNGPAVTTTSSSELFSASTREGDTSSGKFLRTDLPSKFRCHFYFNGTDSLDSTTYIGSFGTSTLDTGISTINQSDMEYSALKVVNGDVSVVCKNGNKTTIRATGERIVDSTTYVLEMQYYPNERIDFFLNDRPLGSITDALPINANVITYFPLMISIKRGSSTNRKVTVENWEFIQDRKT